ncbi:MAG: hypothetical protein JWR34_2756 [Mycobacterium sp.]|nr:hypothetical protein [Mycobacterium sp.]
MKPSAARHRSWRLRRQLLQARQRSRGSGYRQRQRAEPDHRVPPGLFIGWPATSPTRTPPVRGSRRSSCRQAASGRSASTSSTRTSGMLILGLSQPAPQRRRGCSPPAITTWKPPTRRRATAGTWRVRTFLVMVLPRARRCHRSSRATSPLTSPSVSSIAARTPPPRRMRVTVDCGRPGVTYSFGSRSTRCFKATAMFLSARIRYGAANQRRSPPTMREAGRSIVGGHRQIACQLAFDSIHAPSILVAAAISCSPHFGTCRQS